MASDYHRSNVNAAGVRHEQTMNSTPIPDCPACDGDGYTERFNDGQTDVIITLCDCDEVALALFFEHMDNEPNP